MSTKTIYGIFDDEEVLLSSVKEIRANNIDIKEVYSPFPVHGLDKALGLKETRMAITAFIYGCIGLSLGALMIYNIMIIDWPQNIGGKPNWTFYHNMPAFFPFFLRRTAATARRIAVRIRRLGSIRATAGATGRAGRGRTSFASPFLIGFL